MIRKAAGPSTVNAYIKAFPPAVRSILQQVRRTIASVAPQATEAIKYGIPTFVLHGNLVHFAAFKKHIGFFPAPSAIEHFRKELKEYVTSKGTVRFPLDTPIPMDLVKRMVAFRLAENVQKAGGSETR